MCALKKDIRRRRRLPLELACTRVNRVMLINLCTETTKPISHLYIRTKYNNNNSNSTIYSEVPGLGTIKMRAKTFHLVSPTFAECLTMNASYLH